MLGGDIYLVGGVTVEEWGGAQGSAGQVRAGEGLHPACLQCNVLYAGGTLARTLIYSSLQVMTSSNMERYSVEEGR